MPEVRQVRRVENGNDITRELKLSNALPREEEQ